MYQNESYNSCVDDGYEELANALVRQAVKDYRNALKALVKHPHNSRVLSEKKKLERFFRSNWFSILTSIEPEMLIRKLKAEVM